MKVWGSLEAVDYLLSLPSLSSNNFRALQHHCGALGRVAKQGRLSVLRHLLAKSCFSAEQVRHALVAAAGSGQVACLRELLAAGEAADPPSRWDLSTGYRHSFFGYPWASDGDHNRMTSQTVQSCVGSAALFSACVAGSTEAVAFLLSHPSFRTCNLGDTVRSESFASRRRATLTRTVARVCVTAAAELHHWSILELLLADPQVESALSSDGGASADELRGQAQAEQAEREARLADAAGTAGAAAAAHIIEEDEEDEEATASVAAALAAATRAAASRLGGVSPSPATGSASATYWARARASFFAAIDAGDVDGVALALANPLLDPQESLGVHDRYDLKFNIACGSGSAGSSGNYDGGTGFKSKTALQDAVGLRSENPLAALPEGPSTVRRLAIVEMLLADPCWERRHLNAALTDACTAGRLSVVERLLADPHCELSPLPQSGPHGANLRQFGPDNNTPFDAAARHGRAAVLSLLVAKGRRLGFTPVQMRAPIMHGLSLQQCSEGVGAVLCKAPLVLSTCVASLPVAQELFDSPIHTFMRRAVDVAAIGAAAWARRRHVVIAKARAMAGHHDDDDDGDGDEGDHGDDDGDGADK